MVYKWRHSLSHNCKNIFITRVKPDIHGDSRWKSEEKHRRSGVVFCITDFLSPVLKLSNDKVASGDYLEVLEEAKVLLGSLTDMSVKLLWLLSDCRKETMSWITSTPTGELHFFQFSSEKEDMNSDWYQRAEGTEPPQLYLTHFLPLQWGVILLELLTKLSCPPGGSRKWAVLVPKPPDTFAVVGFQLIGQLALVGGQYTLLLCKVADWILCHGNMLGFLKNGNLNWLNGKK